ncbi:glycosyltransferase [Microbacterium sp. RU33B]|uniref:glycosyltransferase n=1 Tax=Microbacterium sp. RU33B TaxID=1907390 RepID=UPI003557E286
MAPADLSDALAEADLVITHGGPGTIATVRSAGLMPIVLARDPALGEHVDEHQLRFAKWAHERGLGIVVDDTAELEEAIGRNGSMKGATAAHPAAQVAASVASFGEKLRVLRSGRAPRRTFPLLRRPRWRDPE